MRPYRLSPAYKERVWGGTALLPHAASLEPGPIGEAWLIHEDQEILPGLSLTDASLQYPEILLGPGARPERFPFLIKLLDCQDWLSVQVHPDDHHARRLVAPDANGKTEAWHVLDATPRAKIVTGVSAEVTTESLQDLIRTRSLPAAMEIQMVSKGDTIFVPAGTIHALGPGLLIYEVQQSSDITYRLYDWDRPETAGRSLHLDESADVARPGEVQFVYERSSASASNGSEVTLLECPYFTLGRLTVTGQPLHRSTNRTGLECLTVVEGEVVLIAGPTRLTLSPFETVLLPAALGAYQLSGQGQLLNVHRSSGNGSAALPSDAA